jgi:hypothetical protein
VPSSPHTAKQLTDMQTAFTKSEASRVVMVSAGVTSVAARDAADKADLQLAVGKEAEAKLT